MGKFVVVFALILLVPGSAFGVWPLYWELDGQKNFVGPLFSYEKEKEQTHVAVRPLLSGYDSPDRYTLIFPLGKKTREKSYFFPFYMSHEQSEKSNDWSFFPFIYGKSGEKTYGGVFPIYGKMYNRFRRDEIGFCMWPIYGYSKYNGTTRRNVLWPFFSFYSGSQEGYKLGPFYGQRQQGENRKSYFVMWPFFIRDEKDLQTDDPKSSTWFMPFYMQTTSPRTTFRAVMWPFFTYMKVPDRTEVVAPWPIFSYTKGKVENAFSIWPLYSHWQKERDEITTVLWPVWKETIRYPGDQRWVRRRVLLINKYQVDDQGKFLNVWPLFEYRSKEENKRFFFPSILPWKNNDFDRIVRPLITLYEYRKEDDKKVTNFLYGFYTKEQNNEYWKRRLAFLFELKREPEGMGFEILGGLFGWDAKRTKILFIPIKRGAPEEDVATAPESGAPDATARDEDIVMAPDSGSPEEDVATAQYAEQSGLSPQYSAQ